MSVSELAIRLLMSFTTLLLLTRWMSRKLLSHMTFFDFISGITIGSIGANLVFNPSLTIRNGLLALLGWSIITVTLGYIDIHSKKARTLLDGEPRILIKNGNIMEHQLKAVRLDIDSLMALLRQKNVFSLQDVNYAIFETNGELSVLKKDAQKEVVKSDLNLTPESHTVPPIGTEIISDGKMVHSNLEKLNLTEEWVHHQLMAKGIQTIQDVFYAEINKEGMLVVDLKDDTDP
nr:DUF421 domain-containing protein [Bacillus sp. Marseille-Q1617]